MYESKVEYILGYPVTQLNLSACVQKILDWAGSDERCHSFACINPHSAYISMKDKHFEQALHNSDLLIPDGIGIVLASKVFGGTIKKRITGSDIFVAISNEANKNLKLKYYFLGSTENVLDGIKKNMSKNYNNIEVVGTYSPPFKQEFSKEENERMITMINNAKPDVLWVGMTAPKQEKWIYENRQYLDVKLVGAIGAVFDFFSGNIRRPHPIYQKIGLEWLPRLIREPKRLWKRNFISSPMFLLLVLKKRFYEK